MKILGSIGSPFCLLIQSKRKQNRVSDSSAVPHFFLSKKLEKKIFRYFCTVHLLFSMDIDSGVGSLIGQKEQTTSDEINSHSAGENFAREREMEKKRT